MKIWFATTNAGKVAEFKSLLMDLNSEIHTLKELKNYYPPKETGSTFMENARLKAQSLKAVLPQEWVVAEDSGLEVAGLNGIPGVHSARYAGEKASDQENNSKLTKMVNLRCPQNRVAQFKCALVCISPSGETKSFEGIVEGQISKKIVGTQGFGYDTCFIPNGEDKTFAELGTAYKNKVSHRAKAIHQLKSYLKSL